MRFTLEQMIMFTIYKLGTISQKGNLFELVGIRKTIIKMTYIKIITKLWRNVPCTCSKLWSLAWGNPWCRRELEEIRRESDGATGRGGVWGGAGLRGDWGGGDVGGAGGRAARVAAFPLSHTTTLLPSAFTPNLVKHWTCRWPILCYPSVVGKIKECYPQEFISAYLKEADMLVTNPHSISPPATYNYRHCYNYRKQGAYLEPIIYILCLYLT